MTTTGQRIELSWETGRSFLAAYDPVGPGRLLAPEGADVRPGDEVQLHARIVERRHEVIALCRVVKSGHAGAMFEFLDGQEGRRDLLLALARGESVPWNTRRSKRVAVILGATLYTSPGKRERVQTVNVSDDGLCVISRGALPKGSVLKLRVWPLPLALMWPPYLRGRVTACTAIKGGNAVGINLQFVSAAQARRWRRMVAAAHRRHR